MTINTRKNNRLDYFPLLSFFLFWLFSALAGALKINDPGILKLGLFTLPAVAALILSSLIIRRNVRLRDAKLRDGKRS